MRTSGLILVLILSFPMVPLEAKARPVDVPQMGVFSSLAPPAAPDLKQHSYALEGRRGQVGLRATPPL